MKSEKIIQKSTVIDCIAASGLLFAEIDKKKVTN